METFYGFIGAGNMGSALARALRGRVSGAQILISNRTPEKAERLAAELEARAVENAEAAALADYLFLGVKPQGMADLLERLRPVLAARERPCVLVSMAAGLSIARIRDLSGVDWPIIRIMPNLPCSVGAGVMLYACSRTSQEQERCFLDALGGAGELFPLDESLFDTGSALSGCGPAYAALFAEALADGAVACGMPRAAALRLSALTLLGSAQLLLAPNAHPALLKDAVCSPNGSTIQGVRALERGGLRAAVIEAVAAAKERNEALGLSPAAAADTRGRTV